MNKTTGYLSVCRVESVQHEFDITRPYMELDHDTVSGSAFLVHAPEGIPVPRGARVLYTNFHVVESNVSKQVLLFFPLLGKTPIRGEILRVYPQSDLAIICVCRKESKKIKHIKNLELSFERVPKFSTAYALGFPLGCDDVQISEGVVSGWEDGHYHLNISINSGNSGGPILDESHRVIAVSVATLCGAEAIGLGIPSVFIKDIVQIPTDPHGDDILCLESTTVAGVRGSIIMSVHEHDCLYLMGFRKGDEILQLGDTKVSAFGMVHVEWMDIPVHWTDSNLMRRVLVRGGCAKVKRSRRKVRLRWKPIDACIPAVRQVYPFYEEIPHLRVGDIVIVPFTLNLVAIAGGALTKELALCAVEPTQRHVQRAVISYVNTFSDLYVSDRVELFDVVTHVNGTRVHTFEDIMEHSKHETLTLNDVIEIHP